MVIFFYFLSTFKYIYLLALRKTDPASGIFLHLGKRGSAAAFARSSMQPPRWVWVDARKEQILRKLPQVFPGVGIPLIPPSCQPRGTSMSDCCPTCPRTITILL